MAACDHDIHPGAVSYNAAGVNPGETICVHGGIYSKLKISNAQGAFGNEIIIRNEDGQVQMTGANDVLFLNCSNVHLTGTGDMGVQYGFYFTDRLLWVRDPHHIEIDHVEMDGARMRIYEDVDEDFEMTDVRVHHNYIHDHDITGIYVGMFGYDTHPGKWMSRRVEIDNNLIEDMDGQAIKTCGVVESCLIHHNIINNVVGNPRALQEAAIKSSYGCDSEVYNNEIHTSGGFGIWVAGYVGLTAEVYNNLVVDCGGGVAYPDAITNLWSDGGLGDMIVYNNTIIGATDHGIDCQGGPAPAVFNNVVLDTTGASIDPGANPPGNFYDNDTKEEGHTPANYDFLDEGGGDYHLTATSPAVDAGAAGFPSDDLDGVLRPQGAAADIGAYEYDSGYLTWDYERSSIMATRKYGVQATVLFPLIDRGFIDFEDTPVVHAVGDTQISKDEGAFGNTANAFAHEGNGIYSLVLTVAEMQAARIVVTIIDQTSPKAWEDRAVIVSTYGNASAQHAFDLDTAMSAVQIADTILTRDWTSVVGEAARSTLNALRFLRNKVSISVATLTVTEEDDTTAAWTATVTSDGGADPIVGIDPV